MAKEYSSDEKDEKNLDPVQKQDLQLLEKYEELWDLDLDDKQVDRLLNIISGLVDDFDKSTKGDREDIYKWDDQYEGILQPKSFPWEGCANYHAPITELNVNALYSRVIKRFRTTDYLRVKAYQDTKDKALLTQKYLRFLFEKRMQYTDLLMSTGRDILKYGSGVFCLTWEYCEKKKKVVVPKAKQVKIGEDPFTKEPIMGDTTEYVIEEQTTFDQGPKIEWVDLVDYMRSEETNRFVEPMWEARRINMSSVEFYHRAMKQDYDEKNVENIMKEELGKQSDGKKYLENLAEREIIEWWGWIRLDEDPMSEPERIVFTYDRKAKKYLKCMRFPYFFDNSNFTVINMERRSNTWRGRGMCQKLEHVNTEMDKLHDLYIDSAAIVTCKSFKKKRGAETNFLLENFYPGVVWDVAKSDDIEVMQLGDNPIAPLKELEMLERLSAKQTGIGSYQTGQDFGGTSQPTASGQLAVIQEGNITLDEIAKEFTFGTIRMARQVLSMVKQFRPESEFIEVLQDKDLEIFKKEEVNIDSLVDDPDLIVVDRSVIEEADYKNQAAEVYNMVRTDPILSQISRVYMASIRNLALAYKTIDSDLLVPTEEELQEAYVRHSQQQQIADMQKEIAKGQTQLQLAQIQAAVAQQKLAAQQQAQQQQIQAQGAEKDKDRQLQLDLQKNQQSADFVQQTLQQPEQEAPAA